MGGRPQKREKASGRKGVGTWFHVEREMDSRWDWVLVVRWNVGTGLRCPRFPLPSFSVGTLGRVYGFTLEAWDVKRVLRC